MMIIINAASSSGEITPSTPINAVTTDSKDHDHTSISHVSSTVRKWFLNFLIASIQHR